ncbi:MAG: hypothetical protein K2X86_01780 [Cytophagaceae bacterium]|nr:hypothetical protein [Cytophagaceae bacterium]
MGSTTIDAGKIVNNIGYRMNLNSVIVNGRLNLGAGGELLIAPENTLLVNAGGRIDAVGTAAALAKVSRQGASGTYTFSVQGQISARHFIFEFMDANGVDLSTGATMVSPSAGTGCFSDGMFTNGVSGGSFLKINQNVSSADTIFNTSFPTIPGPSSYNVTRIGNGAGRLIFKNATGLLAGENLMTDIILQK